MNTSKGGGLAPAVEDILDAARTRTPPADDALDVDARSLPTAIATAEAAGRTPVIAEVKPTSPTTDGERADDPVALARSMVDGGATALSVLTEPEHFGGSTDALAAVRDAVDVPVLRKDFLLTEPELDRVAADVVLLIARFLGDGTSPEASQGRGVDGADDLETMLAAARERGFQALVEVHTAAELERAIEAGATLVGVNNRDLGKLEVDLGTFERLAPQVPDAVRADVTLIAESGVTTTEDAARMRAAGADALLVGSAIMDGDVEANTARLTDADAATASDGGASAGETDDDATTTGGPTAADHEETTR